MRRWYGMAAGLGGLALSLSSAAEGCSVCGFGRDGTSSAYLITAILMSLAALTIFGALAYYMFRQAKDERTRR
jgi:hypothetical protein